MANNQLQPERNSGRISKWLVRVLLGIGLVGAVLYGRNFLPPTGLPLAPDLLSPDNGTVVSGADLQSPVTFRWRQGGNVNANSGNPRPAPAGHFVLCLSKTDEVCEWPETLTVGRWTGPAGDISRVVVDTGGGFRRVFKPRAGPQYKYTFPVSNLTQLPDDFFYGRLRWSVAACAFETSDSCVSSEEGRIIHLLAQNLKLVNIRDTYTPAANKLLFRVEVTNTGTVKSEDYQLVLSIWEIFLDSRDMPRTDVNAVRSEYDTLFATDPNRSGSDFHVLLGGNDAPSKGLAVHYTSLPFQNGNSGPRSTTLGDGSVVVAILKIDPDLTDDQTPLKVFPPPFSVSGLEPGVTGTTLFELENIPVGKGFAAFAKVDPAELIMETDESVLDNTSLETRFVTRN